MNTFHLIYTASWVIACICAFLLGLNDYKAISLFRKQYWLFLLKPWKVVTFIIASVFMVLVAPYSGDYTWDYFDAFFMTVLTYVTAPWVAGIFYKFRLHKVSAKQAYIALCVWLFSASWAYDIYLLWRDKHYPPTWYANMVLSSILYWWCGLLWSLDWQADKGVFFSFTTQKWPEISRGNVFGKIIRNGFIYILIIIILLGMIIYGLQHGKYTSG